MYVSDTVCQSVSKLSRNDEAKAASESAQAPATSAEGVLSTSTGAKR
jgi:hypothetical protein